MKKSNNENRWEDGNCVNPQRHLFWFIYHLIWVGWMLDMRKIEEKQQTYSHSQSRIYVCNFFPSEFPDKFGSSHFFSHVMIEFYVDQQSNKFSYKLKLIFSLAIVLSWCDSSTIPLKVLKWRSSISTISQLLWVVLSRQQLTMPHPRLRWKRMPPQMTRQTDQTVAKIHQDSH